MKDSSSKIKRIKFILFVSLLFNIFFAVIFIRQIYRRGGISYIYTLIQRKPQEQKSNVQQTIKVLAEHRVSLFKLLNTQKNDIYFIGNSITSSGEWDELFQNHTIKNRGINGISTAEMNRQIEYIVRPKPKMIFLELGVNDLHLGVNENEIIKNYESIITKIKIYSPGTKVYILSILPVNKKLCSYGASPDQIKKLNSRIKKIADSNSLTYIDLFTRLVDDKNYMDEKYTYDGIHLLGEGYLVWKSALKPYIEGRTL